MLEETACQHLAYSMHGGRHCMLLMETWSWGTTINLGHRQQLAASSGTWLAQESAIARTSTACSSSTVVAGEAAPTLVA
jgi:hypothetical protein